MKNALPAAELKRRLRLYALADAGVTDARVQAWARGGVTALQLRDKIHPEGIVQDRARQLAALCRQLGILFFINDRCDWQPVTQADGVHLGQSDHPEAARKFLGPDVILGISAADPVQGREALAVGADYLGVGPIFQTSSKADAGTAIGLDGLRLLRRTFPDTPLVAIGGITLERTAAVLAAGADGLAVISALAGQPAEQAAAEFTKRLNQPL